MASPEVCALFEGWLSYLSSEKRFSGHTASNYGRDVLAFLAFAHGHAGEPVSRKTLAGFSLNNFRSFLAARKMEGLGARSLARNLSAVRNFYKYLDKRENLKNAAISEISKSGQHSELEYTKLNQLSVA